MLTKSQTKSLETLKGKITDDVNVDFDLSVNLTESGYGPVFVTVEVNTGNIYLDRYCNAQIGQRGKITVSLATVGTTDFSKVWGN